jgi:hypothetical protein
MFEMTLTLNSTPLAFVDVPNTVTLARLTLITNEKSFFFQIKISLKLKQKWKKLQQERKEQVF